ncbi:Protein of uncharacterised function (DUF1019) [Leclercia adecarboxylata]|uniref:Bacterial toxin YdaT domain-containing protein n=1 Tax=Leclercia adecarboxylata TaxID=83655 RepID=A0A855EGZ7_9ENTR|nr:toxin YdaT family protein [Leclercia adecarboxylata]PHH04079.1 hypothetical protein CRX53_08905 [Leclercia adecarboxylata]UBH69311.1 toxin YdaT domain-containing protein [Leclercia adecarboxylata]SPX62921.1 Protein of uncharacterised function (DUF1019) [Leclercia adecarboxylata]
MQSRIFNHDSSPAPGLVISKYQGLPRKSCELSNIREAVKAWNRATPGDAQNYISQLVAKEWFSRGGRGLLLAGSVHGTKVNFFRMINNIGPKYDKYLEMLTPAIVAVMARDNEAVAREFGLVTGKTNEELIADAIKECAEAQQAKLLGQPIQRLEKEVREAAEALLRFLPTDSLGPVLASLAAMAPGVM